MEAHTSTDIMDPAKPCTVRRPQNLKAGNASHLRHTLPAYMRQTVTGIYFGPIQAVC
jgi:hypothetical protein